MRSISALALPCSLSSRDLGFWHPTRLSQVIGAKGENLRKVQAEHNVDIHVDRYDGTAATDGGIRKVEAKPIAPTEGLEVSTVVFRVLRALRVVFRACSLNVRPFGAVLTIQAVADFVSIGH